MEELGWPRARSGKVRTSQPDPAVSSYRIWSSKLIRGEKLQALRSRTGVGAHVGQDLTERPPYLAPRLLLRHKHDGTAEVIDVPIRQAPTQLLGLGQEGAG